MRLVSGKHALISKLGELKKTQSGFYFTRSSSLVGAGERLCHASWGPNSSRSPLFQFPNNIVDCKFWFWIGLLLSGVQSRQVFSDQPLPYCFQSLSALRPTFRLQRGVLVEYTDWYVMEFSTNKEVIWG